MNTIVIKLKKVFDKLINQNKEIQGSFNLARFFKKDLKSVSASIPEITLTNGMRIFYLRKEEVSTLSKQVQHYFKNGIEVHEGDTVFDVGANIGLFTLWTFQNCKQNVDIYAFEPIPAIFNVLKANAERFNPEKIKVFFCGLSQESKNTTFAWFPNASMLSTQYKNDLKSSQQNLKESILRNITQASWEVRWMYLLPRFLRSFLIEQGLKKVFKIEEVVCQLQTLSEIIYQHNIKQIDLLKIDVEKSELDVLLGIKEQDWPKIKQIVVEIHNIEDRVEKIKNLLFAHGFKQILIEQEPLFRGSEIFNLYALRKSQI